MRERGKEESEVTGGKRGKSFTTTTYFFFFFRPLQVREDTEQADTFSRSVQAVIVPDSGNHKVQVLGGLRRLFLPPSPPKKQAGFWIKTNLLE